MTSLIGNRGLGQLFILSAPAGTGKTTLVKMLTREFPEVVASVSYTTRKPRERESHLVDYAFVTDSEFKEKIINGDFLEYVRLFNTYYGTSRLWVQEKIEQGKHVFLVIDTEGALALREKVRATSIFIRPPSLAALGQRLRLRGTEAEEMIEKRLQQAEKELALGKLYDYEIVNDDLETAYQILRSVVIAESHRLNPSH